MKSLGVVVVTSGLMTISTISMGQGSGEYPDMRGQWKGTSETVVAGSGPHNRTDSAPGTPRPNNQEFILKITRQEGPKFWGELVSKSDVTTKLGVIESDKKTIYMVDNAGGHNTAKLIDPNTLEACYIRPGTDHMLTGCTILHR